MVREEVQFDDDVSKNIRREIQKAIKKKDKQ